MSKRKFTLFVDHGFAGNVPSNPQASLALERIEGLAAEMCHLSILIARFQSGDWLKPFLCIAATKFLNMTISQQENAEMRLAFWNSRRIQCVLKQHLCAHLSMDVQWYRRGEISSFKCWQFHVRISDGAFALVKQK